MKEDSLFSRRWVFHVLVLKQQQEVVLEEREVEEVHSVLREVKLEFEEVVSFQEEEVEELLGLEGVEVVAVVMWQD